MKKDLCGKESIVLAEITLVKDQKKFDTIV
jgi:hypothetical protein